MLRVHPALLCLLICLAAMPSGLAQDAVLRGYQQYASGQYTMAVQTLQTVVSQDPENGEAHYHLANALMKIGHTQHALQEYGRAFSYSTSSQMSMNCAQVLRAYGAPLPQPVPRRMRRLTMTAQQSAPTVTGLREMNSLAQRAQSSQRADTDSHPGDSVKVFPGTPGHDAAWGAWIQNFREAFGRALGAGIRGRGGLSGRVRMVFSVDTAHRLRGRILDSDCPPEINQTVLACTRFLDGKNLLTFPPGATMDGFNFTMSYDWGPPKPRMQPQQLGNNEVVAIQRQRDEAYARMLQQQQEQEQTAAQVIAQETAPKITNKTVAATIQPKKTDVGLHAKPSGTVPETTVAATLASPHVSASLMNKHVSAVIAHRRPRAYHATAGTLRNTNATGFGSSSDVSAMLLPKVEEVGLKATPQSLGSFK